MKQKYPAKDIMSDRRSPEEVSISSPIEDKIAWANSCYFNYGRVLLNDEKIKELLANVKISVRRSYEEMCKTGIVNICRRCDREEGGSCCGAGLENKYDGWLLVMNLLLGTDLPDKRREPESCYFLGENGCLLTARHVICVNYVCRKITSRIKPEAMTRLREKEGEELNRVFLLHEIIKKTVVSLRESA